jgi:mono/diheme cytochrome c family protein
MRYLPCSRLAWLGVLLLLPAGLPAASAARPVVVGFERFYSSEKANLASGGRLLLGELNCTSCHATGDKSASRKQAPVLDGVGSRVRVRHLRKFLADPQAVKPGTTMPNLLAGDPDAKAKVEALVHFLADTGTIRHERLTPKSAAAGRDLYHKVGCFACHGTRTSTGEQDKVQPTSVPLGNLKEKYSVAGLALFLENPHGARPAGRMPKLLDAPEAKAVANFLLQGAKFTVPTGKGSSLYSYYEGQWDVLPDFSKLKPKATGTIGGFDINARLRDNDYALKFDAFLPIDREGTYRFSLTSDDGSRLLIDGKTVVDNDGVHATTTKKGRIRLTRGVHRITVTFFQVGGEAALEAFIDGPGLGYRNLSDIVASSEEALKKKPKPKTDDPDLLDVKPHLVEKGKALFASLGCAACHIVTDKKPIASTRTAGALAKLDTRKGCLSPSPQRGVPLYGLSEQQRKALAAAIGAPAPPKSNQETISATLTTFNCYACHVRDKVGGPEEALNKQFLTVQPEMGDEGRLPPPLDGVGAKLTADYFEQILDKGAHDRPYMHTRMPGFGRANVGHLVGVFEKLDKLPSIPAVKFEEAHGKVKATARRLVGGGAFGCIKCHTFAGHKAEGVQGIDMVLMPKRLRRDWFHAYIADPQRIRPGTRMPAAFLDGKSVLPDVLDGTALKQIEAMWLYLLDGPKAQVPAGMGASSIPLEPTANAIIYRNFISGAGPRAIGVGYPEKASIAFDANEMRLALLWQGAFIDAARHWTDRGAGFEGPLGDNILALHGGATFAVLGKPDEPWSTAAPKMRGYRFLGYKLTTDDRPTFRYSFAGVTVEDFPNAVPAGKDVLLRRTFTLTAEKAPEDLYFRAAVGNRIKELPGGWYQIDNVWKLKVGKGVQARVRKSGGKEELLVRVKFTAGKARLVHDYSW